MSRVLVTGGAGFIPSNLIRHLLAHSEHDVISLDALTYAGNLENLAEVMSHPRLEFVHGDIRDAGLVDEVVAYVAPMLLGSGASAVGDLGIATVTDALRLELRDVARLGTDVRLTMSGPR